MLYIQISILREMLFEGAERGFAGHAFPWGARDRLMEGRAIYLVSIYLHGGDIGLTEQVGGVICIGLHADIIVEGSAVHWQPRGGRFHHNRLTHWLSLLFDYVDK